MTITIRYKGEIIVFIEDVTSVYIDGFYARWYINNRFGGSIFFEDGITATYGRLWE